MSSVIKKENNAAVMLKKKKGSSLESKSDKLQVLLMLAPSVIFLVVFSIYPIVWVLRYMFFEYHDTIKAAKFIGLDNFVRLFKNDPIFWTSVKNTLIYGGGKIILTIPPSFLLALFLNEKIKGRDFIRGTIFMPTIIATAVTSMMFYYILNPYNGVLNEIMLSWGLIKQPINWMGNKWAMTACIIVAAWGAIGNYMVYFLSGLQSIPTELYESASIDGASKLQTIWNITIPLLGPVMQIIIMLAITVSLKGYESIMVLTSGGPAGKTEVMFLYVYRLFFPMAEGSDIQTDFGYGAAVAFISALIVGLITVLYLWMSKKMDENV